MMTTRMLRTAANFVATLSLAVVIHPAAYGQVERDTSGESRSVAGESKLDREMTPESKETPEAFFNKELRKVRGAPNVARFRSMKSNVAMFGLDGSAAAEDKVTQAFNNAKRDYAEVFQKKFEDSNYGKTHVRLRLEDFARAYMIVLNPAVGKSISSGFSLAEKRSQVILYESYEEVIREAAPNLDDKTIRDIVKAAKITVKALLP